MVLLSGGWCGYRVEDAACAEGCMSHVVSKISASLRTVHQHSGLNKVCKGAMPGRDLAILLHLGSERDVNTPASSKIVLSFPVGGADNSHVDPRREILLTGDLDHAAARPKVTVSGLVR